jgi:hypothetical protein
MNSPSRPPKIAYVSVSNFEKKRTPSEIQLRHGQQPIHHHPPASSWESPRRSVGRPGVIPYLDSPMDPTDFTAKRRPSFRMSTLSRHLSHSSSTNCWILSNFRSCQRGWSWSHQPISHESHTRKVTLDRIVSPTPHDPTNRRTCFPRFPSIIPVSREELGSQMSPAGDHENTIVMSTPDS